MLIRNAEIWCRSGQSGRADVRIEDDRIAAIGALEPRPGETWIDAQGGALLPGLHDHHIHLAALAVRRSSLWCGPPQVMDEAALAAAIAQAPGTGWLRGIGYHDSVAGMLDKAQLDRLALARPLRIQHRSGRMWFFNSAGLEALRGSDVAPPPGLDLATGRLFDADAWLRTTLAGSPPDFSEISRELAACGVTGLTDMSPANDAVMAQHFAQQIAVQALLQRTDLAGTLGLSFTPTPLLRASHAKLHLHEADLPDWDTGLGFIRAAHAQDRSVAIHCASEVELVFALALYREAGTLTGDRIEHASVASDELVAQIAELGLAVVSQPHFIAERGDEYRADVDAADLPHLYRLRAFLDAGITLAGGSDAPFGAADPWAAMQAATMRQTPSGALIGPTEALTPEQALALFLADPLDLRRTRQIVPGAPADLCLLDRPWGEARSRLTSADVRATFVAGRIVHQRIDQSPL